MTRVRMGREATLRAVAAPALDGILVADFSRVLAGPLCTMTLGDLGRRRDQGRAARRRRRHARLGPAVRRRGRDLLPRPQPQQALGDARPQGPRRRGARPRAGARADVVVENFRPGHDRPPGAGLRRGRARQPGRRLLLDQRVRLGRAGRGAARLRPAAAGDGRADVGDRRARRAPAEGRRGAGRHGLRPVRDDRHARRAARARARRARPARRGLAHGHRAGRRCSTRPRRTSTPASCRAAWATATRRSRRTRPSPPPTATSRSRSATTRSSRRLCGGDRPPRARRATSASPPTRRGWSTARSWRAELEAAFAAAPAAEWVARLGERRRAGRPDQRHRPGVRVRRRARPRARRRDRGRAHGALAPAPRRDAGGRAPPAAAPRRARDEIRAGSGGQADWRDKPPLAGRGIYDPAASVASCG